ncbi:MAG: hypothetical protein IKG47_00355 [Oscillospiraceae bacterium]|nr:hypothetical protein [Oscillospiraceae bacterium]
MLEILTELRRCPICGSKAFLSHDVVDGFDFGYSVGCPRACINDGIHGFNDSESFKNAKLVFHGFLRKEDAINTWNKRAEC